MLAHFRKPHGILLVLIAVFAIAWALWTFVWLPRSESPNLPDPSATPAAVPTAP